MNPMIHENIQIEKWHLTNFTKLDTDLLDMILRWRNHEAVRKWMYNDYIITEQEHIEFVNSLNKASDRAYWLVREGNTYIGVMSLTRISWRHKRAYFGIYSNPEEKIVGVGKILVKLAICTAFDILELHTLRLEVIENNEKAIQLYLNMDFQEEGRLKDFVYKEGNWLDVIVMGMINPREREKDENSRG